MLIVWPSLPGVDPFPWSGDAPVVLPLDVVGLVFTPAGSVREVGGASAITAVSVGLTASGSSQLTAAALPSAINQFSTVGAGLGAVLVSGLARPIVVVNRGVNPMLVWPPYSAQIEGLGANNPAVVIVGGSATFLETVAGAHWEAS